MVHKGFILTWEGHKEKGLLDALQALVTANPSATILLTGHSQGVKKNKKIKKNKK